MSEVSQASQDQDPALLAQRPLPTQPYLEPSAIEWLIICFAHDPQIFAEARTLIQSHHFRPHELPLRMMYDALCHSIDTYGGCTYETLANYIADEISQNQTLALTQVQHDIIFRRDTEGLIWQTCYPTGVDITSTTNRNFSRELLRRLAYERTVVEPLRKVMNPGFNQGIPEGLDEFFRVINRQNDRLATLNSMPEFDLTPAIGSQLVQANRFQKTGVAFIDEVLGGQRPGDCNGLIGPTGGGKTTLAVHLAVSTAKQLWVEAQGTGRKPGLVVFVTAEEAGIKLRPRIWSAFFQIPRSKLETLTSWDQLTTPGKLDQYENAMQADQPYKLSEIERYQAYGPQLQSCLKTLDLSGSEEFPNAGCGYIPEIVSYLARYDQPIVSVFIDYAGIFVERYMAVNGMDERNYRYLLKTFGDRCRQEISARFGCTTWVLHQLKGSLGDARAAKLMRHTDAGESADFANNMVVCGCLGTADPVTGCRRLNWSKTRYLQNEKIIPATLRIHDEFAIMQDVTNLFAISESGQFLSPDEMRQIRATDALERNLPTGGPVGLRSTSNVTQRADV